jgi:RNA polymerase sigma-70 factor (ECF subfamily)
LANRATAEDVTSEVFLQVASRWRDFPGRSEEDFRRWLFRIATNGVLAQQRKSGRRQELLESAVQNGYFSRASGGDLDATDWPAVYAAIAELGEREQTIVALRFFADLSHEDIAGVVESTPGAVRTSLSRALARLRGKFGEPRSA